MSAKPAKEKDVARRGSAKGETREYERTFLVETTRDDEGAKVVRQARGIPTKGTPYATAGEFDSEAKVNNIACRQISARWWEVDVRYSSNPDSNEQQPTESEKPADPLDWPIVYRWGHTTVMEPLEEDGNGVPVRSSAGDPFDPPLEIEVFRTTCSITRNDKVQFDPHVARQFCGKRNSDRWLGFEVGWARCVGIQTGDSQRWNGVDFYAVTYDFVFDEKLWVKRVADRGPHYFETINGAKKKVLDRDARGVLTGKTVYLNGKGEKLNFTAPVDNPEDAAYNPGGEDPKGGKIFWLQFQPFKSIAFARLGLT